MKAGVVIEFLIWLAGWLWGCMWFGMYLGERGRRIASERRETTGSPLGASARRIPPPIDTEQLVTATHRTVRTAAPADALSRIASTIIRRGRARGRVITEDEALREAEELVRLADQGGP